MRVVALIPAAGRATRLGSVVSGSKEVAPIAGRPAIGHLLHRLELASVGRALVVVRHGKWDIPTSLINYDTDVSIAHVVVDETPSQLHSVARGLDFLEEELVALAYPDILFEPKDAFSRLLDRQASTGADLVLGLFPCDFPERVDMVVLDNEARPIEIVIKEPDRGLRYSWSIAVWAPRFTRLLIDFVHRIDSGLEEVVVQSLADEPSVGHIIQRAIADDFSAEAVVFEEGSYIDIGTPDDLARARSELQGNAS